MPLYYPVNPKALRHFSRDLLGTSSLLWGLMEKAPEATPRTAVWRSRGFGEIDTRIRDELLFPDEGTKAHTA